MQTVAVSYCRRCGTQLVKGRIASYSPADGSPIFTFVCPKDRWWDLGLPGHSIVLQGREIRP